MYKYTERITQVKDFDIVDDKYYYSSGLNIRERIVTYRSSINSKIITIPNKVFSIRRGEISNGLWVNLKGKSLLFNDDIVKKELSNFLVLKELSHDKVLGIKEGDNNFVIWNIEDNQIINTLPFSTTYYYVNSNIIYAVIFSETLERKKIIAFDIENHIIIWEFYLRECDEIKDKEVTKILSIFNDGLWVALTSHSLIKICPKTGVLLNHLNKVEEFNSLWLPSEIPEPRAMIYDPDNDCLIGLMFEFFWRISSKSEYLEFHDLTNYLKRNKIRNQNENYLLIKGAIFFACENKIGSLCTQTLKLQWIHEFKPDKNGYAPNILNLKGNEQILLAQDGGRNLYVFESIRD